MKPVGNFFRKIMGVSLAVCVMCTNIAFAQAENDEEVFRLRDLSANDGSVITTTQADIVNEHWNLAALGDVSPEIYQEFPMEINKVVDEQARLQLSFKYLKHINAGDTVTFTMTERDTGTLYFSQNVSADQIQFSVSNVPMDKVYDLSIAESLGGAEAIYEAVIKTYRTAATMPSNVSIDGSTNGQNSAIAETITVAEVSQTDDTVIEDEAGNLFMIAANEETEKTTVAASTFGELYAALPEDKLYCLQTEAEEEGVANHYTGYFSKSPELSQYGIFLPAYTFYPAGEYGGISAQSARVSHPWYTPSEVKSKAVEYKFMEDGRFSLPTGATDDDFIVISFKFPEDGSYTIETLGNLATSAEYWEDYNGTPRYRNLRSGNGGNFSQTIQIVEGSIRYWVVYFDDTSRGSSIFRIKANNYPNDRSNSVYELELSDSNKSACNVAFAEEIEYAKDVDIFYVDNAEAGQYGLQLKNNSSAPLQMVLYSRSTAESSLWTEATKTVRANGQITYLPKLSGPKYHYFIKVQAESVSSSGNNYTLQIMSPTKPDPYEPNNTFETASDLVAIDGTYGEINDLTIHKGDIDYFKFTTGAYGSYFYVWLNEVNEVQYNLELYKQTAGTPTLVTTAADFNGTHLEVSDLDPNTTYYVCVNNQGLGAEAYTSVLLTQLSWEIRHNEPQASAVLSGNVAYRYTKGETITNLDGFRAEIMKQMTCYQGTTEIADSVAVNDIALFYMNGSAKTALTPAAVSAMSAGTYTVIAEYAGVEATGGTITLTVEEEPVGTIVELPEILPEVIFDDKWDWAACAKMLANNRLQREGAALTTKLVDDAIDFFTTNETRYDRGTLDDSVKAANFFYANGNTEINKFARQSINVNYAEMALLSHLKAGKAIMILLTSTVDPADYSLGRYVLLCGINTGTHEYKIIDPLKGTTEWVPHSILASGGYNGDANLRFTGGVIEYR